MGVYAPAFCQPDLPVKKKLISGELGLLKAYDICKTLQVRELRDIHSTSDNKAGGFSVEARAWERACSHKIKRAASVITAVEHSLR